MSATVRHEPDRSRYVIEDDGQLAGFADVERDGNRIAFTHTEVAAEYGGRGLARQLVSEALTDARRRGLAVLPLCSYVRKVIADEPDAWLDLVPEDERGRLGLADKSF